MKRMFHALLAASALLTLAPPVPAQDAAPANSWTLNRLREGSSVIATAPFDNGITVIARCSNNVFSLILAGLPSAPGDGDARDLILLLGNETNEQPNAWTVASDRTAAFSRSSARMARQLLQGGRLQIIIPAQPGGRRTRYIMNLEPSTAAVQDALSHCGRPLVDPRDEKLLGTGRGLPTGYRWAQPPMPEFPSATVHGSTTGGTVTLSCDVEPNGRLTDCIIEDEFPVGRDLGVAVRRSIGAARVGLTDEGRASGLALGDGRILFTVNFRLG